MEQETIAQKLKKKKKKKVIIVMTIQELKERLIILMKNHIGADKYITKEQIFKTIFGDPSNYSTLQIWYIWKQMLPKAMNWVRKTSKCFIVMKRIAGYTHGYYIPKTRKDIAYYDYFLKNQIRRMNYMRTRAEKAVDEKWYRQYE